MLNFILMNLIAISGAMLIAKYFFSFYSRLDYLISLFVLFLSWIIGSLLALGIAGKLTLLNVIMLDLLTLFIIYLIIKLFRLQPINRGFVHSELSMVEIFSEKSLAFCLSLLIGFVIVKILVNFINPPFGWDSINYHYTFPVEWLKHFNLDNPIVISDDFSPSYYPINGSLVFLWLILPFKSAFLADIGQFPFFIVSIIAVISISRKIGLSVKSSLLASCLFAIIPNYFKQLQIGYVDIMVGTMFLVCVNSLFDLKENCDLKKIVLFSLAFAIFIGLKLIALSYSTLLFLPFIYLIFRNKTIKISLKINFIALFFFLVCIFGSFSYIKNFILTGNPLYPLKLSFMRAEIFKGVLDKITYSARNTATDYSLSKLLFHEGLGIQTILFVLPGAFLAPIVNILKNKDKGLFLNYILLMPVFLYFIFRFIIPLPNTRYLYSLLGLGMIAGFFLLKVFKIPNKVIRILSIIAVLASLSECARHSELVFSILFGLGIFIALICLAKIKKLDFLRIPKKGAILGLSLAALVAIYFLFGNYKAYEYQRYIENSSFWPDATKAWFWLNENTKGNNIAYVGRPVPYPLYGADFKNNVSYISVNAKDPVHIHDFRDSKYNWDSDAQNMHKSFRDTFNYRGNADYNIWLDNLKRSKIDFLFVYSLHHTKEIMFPIEENWAKDHPEKFKLVFTNDTIRIYALNK